MWLKLFAALVFDNRTKVNEAKNERMNHLYIEWLNDHPAGF